MKYADLHIHSIYSDGSLTPEEIVHVAIEKGIKVISITDHDNIGAQYITKNKYNNICIIPGVEFSTVYKDLEIHILGYFIDIDNQELIEFLDEAMNLRISRIKKILNKLKENNIHIELDDLLNDNRYSIGRGNLAKEMVKRGYVKTFKEAFTKYLIQGKVAYVPGIKKEYKEILTMINKCGGISVLAHPGKIYKSTEVENIVKEFKCYGLKGIEVYHSSHSKEQENYFYNLSKKYKLLVTGGSDFHKAIGNEHIMGEIGINEERFNKLLSLCTK